MGKSETKFLQWKAVEFKGFLWGIRIKPHQGSVKHDSPERAQEILQTGGWKLWGELSICNVSYTVLAAPGTICCSRQTLGPMPHDLYVPVPPLAHRNPWPHWSWEMTQTTSGLQPKSLHLPLNANIQSTKLPSIFLLLTPFLYLLLFLCPTFSNPTLLKNSTAHQPVLHMASLCCLILADSD